MLLPVPAPAGQADAVVDGDDDLLTLSPFEGSPVLSRQRPQEY
jgi:predicted nucleic acid-binding protein